MLSLTNDINFSEPQIVYNENNYNARKFLESWNIHQNKYNGIQLMNDHKNQNTNIPKQYLALLNNLISNI